METAVKFDKITKTFGSLIANNEVTMEVRRGEILALLGENGSGKTTLMNMLSGIYYPDGGKIFIKDSEVSIRSPKDAFDLGIGMIHQHFKLINVFTAAENVVLGLGKKYKFDMKAAAAKIKEISERYGFSVEPSKKVYDMSVSEKQTLEIIKVLYRGADILILDEPTAVLTPQEADKLFAVIRNMRDDGKSIIIITHKLNEVLAVSDRVAVLRKGDYIGTVDTKDATERSLTEMMVGQKVELNIERPLPTDRKKRLVIENLSCKNAEGHITLDSAGFTAYSGEILGIAGISGSGQKELLEAIAGLQRTLPGSSVKYFPEGSESGDELIGKTPGEIRELGVALSFVPEDRLGMGLVGSMGMTDNMLLRSYRAGKSPFLSKAEPKTLAEKVKEDLDVMTPGLNTSVRKLSGGNVQKVLVGREIASAPSVLLTAYAVRGLDINTSYTIYRLLNEQKQKGVAVIYVGEDLDVLLAISDRIMVLLGGKVNGILDGRNTTKEEVGLLMTSLADSTAEELKEKHAFRDKATEATAQGKLKELLEEGTEQFKKGAKKLAGFSKELCVKIKTTASKAFEKKEEVGLLMTSLADSTAEELKEKHALRDKATEATAQGKLKELLEEGTEQFKKGAKKLAGFSKELCVKIKTTASKAFEKKEEKDKDDKNKNSL